MSTKVVGKSISMLDFGRKMHLMNGRSFVVLTLQNLCCLLSFCKLQKKTTIYSSNELDKLSLFLYFFFQVFFGFKENPKPYTSFSSNFIFQVFKNSFKKNFFVVSLLENVAGSSTFIYFSFFFSSYCGLDCTQHLASTLAHLFKTLNHILLMFLFLLIIHILVMFFFPSCSPFTTFYFAFCSIQSLIQGI
jgi:hypothetical protein